MQSFEYECIPLFRQKIGGSSKAETPFTRKSPWKGLQSATASLKRSGIDNFLVSSFMNISKNFWGNKFLQHGEPTSEPLALHHWMPTPDRPFVSAVLCSFWLAGGGHFPRCFAQGKQRIHITIGNRQKHYITQDLFHTLQWTNIALENGRFGDDLLGHSMGMI